MLPTLEEAIQAIKAGDKETGRQMLADILQADLENEQAWLWLSGVVDSDDEKRKYLNRVLEINPDNRAAKRGLHLLDQKETDQAEQVTPPESSPQPESAGPLLARLTDSQQSQQPQPVDALAGEPEPEPESLLATPPPVEQTPVSQPEPATPAEVEVQPEPVEPIPFVPEPPPPEPETAPVEEKIATDEPETSPPPPEEVDLTEPQAVDQPVEEQATLSPVEASKSSNQSLTLIAGVTVLLFICAACVIGALIFQPVLNDISPTVVAIISTATPTPTVTSTATLTLTPTETPTATPTSTPAPTLTATPTGTRVVADTPTVTPFPTRTATPDPNRQSGLVVGVVAGNIIDVIIDGAEYRVKYLLIDTPAVNDPEQGTESFGPEALEINRALVEGQTISLEKDVTDSDEFGRLLRYVYVGDLLVNEELIRQGVAWVAPVPPDLKYQTRFQEVQNAIQAEGIGVWSQLSSVRPTPPPPAQIVIVAVDDVEEYVDLQNVGNGPQDLTAWKLVSERDGQECVLEGVVIQPGETLRIWALLADSSRGGYNCGFTQNIWSNTEPDPAVLYTPDGIEVSRLD